MYDAQKWPIFFLAAKNMRLFYTANPSRIFAAKYISHLTLCVLENLMDPWLNTLLSYYTIWPRFIPCFFFLHVVLGRNLAFSV